MFNNGLKAKRQKFGIGSLILLLLFGAVFTGVGFFALNGTAIDAEWQRIPGEIIDVKSGISDSSTTYSAVVKYSVNGEDYRIISSFGSSFAPTIGEKREVVYNPSQPTQAKVVEDASTTWWLWIFPIVGIVILISAPVSFIRSLLRSREIRRLTQTGQKLQGVMTDLQPTSTNNRSSKIVVSAVDMTGTTQSYLSDPISGIGGLAMADFQTNPIAIDVYVDPLNPKNYYVDISDVPGLTPQRINELLQSAAKRMQPSTLVTPQPTIPPVDNPQPPAPKL